MDKKTAGSPATIEFLKLIYLDATETIRHYDTIRASFTQIFAGIIAVFTSAGAALFSYVAIEWLFIGSVVLVLLSCASFVAILQINRLIVLQRRRASIAMKDYQNVVDEFDFTSINVRAREAAKSFVVRRLGLGTVWASIFAILGLANFGILSLSLFFLISR